jgi:hypothetical protein
MVAGDLPTMLAFYSKRELKRGWTADGADGL